MNFSEHFEECLKRFLKNILYEIFFFKDIKDRFHLSKHIKPFNRKKKNM